MKNKPEISVSIIIPTYNRKSSLIRTLTCLNSQSFPYEKMEVIIVDDGSTDDTLQNVNDMASKMSYSLVTVKSFRIGPGPARNIGLNIAKGQIILFTDSDCEPDYNWITEMVKALDSNKSVACGFVNTPRNYNPISKCVNFILSTWLGGMGRTWRLFGFIPGLRLRTMNVAFYCDAVKEVGGFLNSGCFYGEDTEFGERLQNNGYKLKHCKSGILYHCEERNILDYGLESIAKGMATAFMIRNNLIKFRGIYILPQMLLLLVFGIIIGLIFNFTIATFCIQIFLIYMTILMWYSIRSAIKLKCIKSILFLSPIALFLHCSYALGLFLGILHFKVPQKGAKGAVFSI